MKMSLVYLVRRNGMYTEIQNILYNEEIDCFLLIDSTRPGNYDVDRCISQSSMQSHVKLIGVLRLHVGTRVKLHQMVIKEKAINAS